jgi:hypothetical protein
MDIQAAVSPTKQIADVCALEMNFSQQVDILS